MRASLFAPLFVVALGAACGTEQLDVLARADAGAAAPVANGPDGAATGNTSDAGAGDAANGDAGPLTREGYCANGGPLLAGPAGTAGAPCAGGVAGSVFRYAICACDELVSNQPLSTDAFDSSRGAYTPATARPTGGVGTNGTLRSSGTLSVGGSLWVAATAGALFGAKTDVTGELHCGGPLQADGDVFVGSNAWVAGDVAAHRALTVNGKLHIPAGRAVAVDGQKQVAATVVEPVSVGAACECGTASRVDVAKLVEAAKTANDNTTAGVRADMLANVQTALDVPLPCGRFYLTTIAGVGPFTLRVSGHTALYLAGDLAPAGPFEIIASPDAELDLFVGGNVVAGGEFRLGDAAHPARTRLYVGGSGTLDLSRQTTLAGNIHAPRAELVLSGAMELFGALLVRRLNVGGALRVHYDEAMLTGGRSCLPTAGNCESCLDCGDKACVAGVCAPCTDSAQCCAPLICAYGTCQALAH